MHLIGLAASAMSDLSRIWCQMRLALTSKLIVYQCCVSMYGEVSLSTRLWHLNHSIGWRKYIRFWDQDYSEGWRKCIWLWDSAGWRKATRGITRQQRIIGLGWHNVVSIQVVRTRTRLVQLNEKIQKQRVSLFFRLLVSGEKFRQIKLYE